MTEPAKALIEELPTECLNAWQRYERRKAQLPEDLTPEEYRAACKQIADELGV